MRQRVYLVLAAIVVFIIGALGGRSVGYNMGRQKSFDDFYSCVIQNVNNDGWVAMKCVLEGYSEDQQ